MPGNPAIDEVRAAIVRGLREELGAAGDADAALLRRDYQRRAEDYRTLALMQELPAHADGALAALRAAYIVADGVSEDVLLRLLAGCYAEAAAPQSGQ